MFTNAVVARINPKVPAERRGFILLFGAPK